MGKWIISAMKSKFYIYLVLLGGMLLALPAVMEAQFPPLFQYTTNGETFFYNTNGNGGAIIIAGAGTNVIVVPGTLNGLPVVSIGADYFTGRSINPPIASVIITNANITIGDWAFFLCPNLTNIVIGSGITSIGYNAFARCAILSQVTVDPLNPAYSTAGGILFDKNQTTLIRCLINPVGNYTVPGTVTNIAPAAFAQCTQLTSITIPSSVTCIGSNAFDFCAGLGGITIPDSVTSIGPSAFTMCTSLTNVTLGSGLTTVGDSAFILCTNLPSIIIPGSVTTIGNDAFEFCTGLTNITIGAGVTSIGDSAFWGCARLVNVSLPANVTNVANDAFWSCTGLTNIAIGSGVIGIGTNAFYWCPSLAAIKVDSLNPSYSSVNGVLFDKGRTTLVEYPNALAGDYAVPDGVAIIGNFAFSDSSFLTTVTLPSSMYYIGVSGFEDCTSLSGLYFYGYAPGADPSAFNYDTNVFVYYLPGAGGFGATYDGLPVAPWIFQVQTGPGSFGIQTNGFGFHITGPTNFAAVIEGCTNLSGQGWMPIQTNITGGTFYFSDPLWTNYPSRFYRVYSP